MAKEKGNNPQSQEDRIKATQEAAIKAAMEQAQSMFGNIPGFQMPDMDDMQAQIMAQMKAAVPNLDEIQAQQAAMGTLGDFDATTAEEECRQNMDYARQMMQQIQDGTLDDKLEETEATLSQMLDDFDTEWEIYRTENSHLNAEQRRLLAFGAPLLVYNDEEVDTIESDIDVSIIKSQLESWWEITDRDSTLEIVEWLLKEGHHTDVDETSRTLIVELMLENGYCTEKDIPQTAIAWDLVRVVNVGRWAYLCGYIAEDEMWRIMQQATEAAKQHFTSWEEYGRSFVLGRGVWHGNPDECETAQEIISVLLTDEDSPWKEYAW